jgi:hypothetical protein
VSEHQGESSCDTAEEEKECFFNTGRPFVLLAFGCHMGDFDSEVETMPTGTDAVAEKIFLNANAGSIGSYSSGAFELLSNNITLNQKIMEAIFCSLPDTNLQGDDVGPRWILGEFITAGALRSAAAGNYRPVFNHALLGDPGLRIDAGIPQMLVTVDGDTVSSGETIETAGTSDSVSIVAWVTDEVQIDSVWVELDGARVSETDFTVETIGQPGKKRLSYTFPVLPGNYSLFIRAIDGNGRDAEFELLVETDTAFRITVGGKPIADGDVLGVSFPLHLTITSPSPVSQNDIAVALDGNDITGLFQFTQNDSYGKSWSFASVGPISFGAGDHTVSVLLLGNPVGEIHFTSVATLRITNVANFPNPFSSGTTVLFNLNKPVDSVIIDIYTVSGRKVVSLPLESPQVGYNEVYWAAEDDVGAQVSSGVYFYKIRVTSADNEQKEHTGKMARIRGLLE